MEPLTKDHTVLISDVRNRASISVIELSRGFAEVNAVWRTIRGIAWDGHRMDMNAILGEMEGL